MIDDDMLAKMFARQHYLQTEVYGYDYEAMTDEERVTFIKDMVLATEDELHEALDEVGWKPWATSRHVNREAYVGELVDALHFILNLCLVVEVEPEELFTRYMAKSEVNAARQRDGYDGVSTKCPMCKRAYDDEAVKCEADASASGMPGDSYCERFGFHRMRQA